MKSIEEIIYDLSKIIKKSIDNLEKNTREIKKRHKFQKKCDNIFNKKWKKDPPDEF